MSILSGTSFPARRGTTLFQRNGLARVPRRLSYAALGALLSIGAPIGLLLVRLHRHGRISLARISAEVSGNVPTYRYISTSTGLVFSLFGGMLGRHADRLAELATTDALTGLQNARALQEGLQREVARAVRDRQPLSLLLIDLDGLKVINDRLGHHAGDRALCHVAEAIGVQLRASDIGVRWGGDEFALLAPNTRGSAAAVLAQRVQSLVGHAPASSAVPPMAVSIGIATFDPDGTVQVDASSLMSAADAALYHAKRSGRDRIVIGHLTSVSEGPTREVRERRS
jgi:diguanylate cyclase (GGDEF)-like protein